MMLKNTRSFVAKAGFISAVLYNTDRPGVHEARHKDISFLLPFLMWLTITHIKHKLCD